MASASDLTDALENAANTIAAAGVQSYREGQNSAEMIKLKDLIEAHRYFQANQDPPAFDIIEVVDI